MAESIFHVLVEFVQLGLVYTGNAVVRSTSAGRWRPVSLNGDEARIYGMAGALSFRRDGQRVITRLGLMFVGAGFYAVLVFAGIGLAS